MCIGHPSNYLGYMYSLYCYQCMCVGLIERAYISFEREKKDTLWFRLFFFFCLIRHILIKINKFVVVIAIIKMLIFFVFFVFLFLYTWTKSIWIYKLLLHLIEWISLVRESFKLLWTIYIWTNFWIKKVKIEKFFGNVKFNSLWNLTIK